MRNVEIVRVLGRRFVMLGGVAWQGTEMRRTHLAILAAIAMTTGARADAPSTLWYGANLQRLCSADRKSAEYAMCWSFISAVLEIAMDNTIYGSKPCISPMPNPDKAVELTKRWLQDHPETEIEPASHAATDALAQAFPCDRPH
jgi:hypothetical protein